MNRKISFGLAFFAALALVCAIPSRADEVSHARVVRLSLVEGDVAYQIGSGGTWQRAMMNLPIQQSFSLRTDAGYAEVEFESGLVIRLAQKTQIEFPELSLIDGRKVTSVKLDSGTIVATSENGKTDQFTVRSGNLEIAVPKNGRFRVDANATQNWVTVSHGKVDVTQGDKNFVVDSGNTLHDAGGDADGITTAKNSSQDAFDKWVAQRDEAQSNSQTAAGDFASQKNYPATLADLYDYGLWFNVPGYGTAWQPYGVGAGWMPFSLGQWTYMDAGLGAGWNWISDEPWGWMPYHYGAWLDVPGEGWFWFPENMGLFVPGNASFVNVGGVTGWTPVLATPTNPTKVRLAPTSPIHVVMAGAAGNGVISAGMRGTVNQGIVTRSSGLAANFSQQAAPSVLGLTGAGMKITGFAAVRTQSRSFAYAGQTNAMNSGRPVMQAPHASAISVAHAPGALARANGPIGGSGIRPAGGGNSGASGVSAASHAAPSATSSSAGHTGGASSSGASGSAAGHH